MLSAPTYQSGSCAFGSMDVGFSAIPYLYMRTTWPMPFVIGDVPIAGLPSRSLNPVSACESTASEVAATEGLSSSSGVV